MSGQEVPRVQTLCDPKTLYLAFWNAWTRLIPGSQPTRMSVLVLVAHWALETGYGHACWNWNFGNKKHVASNPRPFYYVRCSEIEGGKEVWYDPPSPACAFVSFYNPNDPKNMQDGVDDYLLGLVHEFGIAWPAVIAGDPALFCHLLKQARYYTAVESVYTGGVVRCYQQLDHTIPIGDPSAEDLAKAALDQAVVQLDIAHEDNES